MPGGRLGVISVMAGCSLNTLAGAVTAIVQTAGVLVAWVGSVAAGAAFHHAVEVPLRRWSSGHADAFAGLRLRLPFATVLRTGK